MVIFSWTRDGSPFSFALATWRRISKFPSSGQPCAFCALLIPTTGSPSDRGPNGTVTDNAGNLSGRLGRRWAVRTDGMESLRRSRTISRGALGRAEPHLVPPMRTPSPPPHARLSSSSSLPGTEVVMQRRPDHLRLTPPSSVGRAHVFYLTHAATPSPPSLFSCDISDSVTPPPSSASTDCPSIFPHLAKEKKNT